MAPSINLDDTTPQELNRLLDSVKTSNLEINEKEAWIQKIQSKLGIVMRDSKEKKSF